VLVFIAEIVIHIFAFISLLLRLDVNADLSRLQHRQSVFKPQKEGTLLSSLQNPNRLMSLSCLQPIGVELNVTEAFTVLREFLKSLSYG